MASQEIPAFFPIRTNTPAVPRSVINASVSGRPAKVEVRFKSDRYHRFFCLDERVSASARKKSMTVPRSVAQTAIQTLFLIATR